MQITTSKETIVHLKSMRLQDAASKVREVVEENAMLSKRLDKAIRRESQLEADILERQKRLRYF